MVIAKLSKVGILIMSKFDRALNTAHQLCICQVTYTYSVTDYDDVLELFRQTW